MVGKKCRVCKVEKDCEEFAINKATHDGYDTICKKCKAYRDKVKYRKRRKEGLCVNCEKDAIPEHALCKQCWFEYTANRLGTDVGVLTDKWEEQKGRCAYLGNILHHCDNAAWRNERWVSKSVAAVIDMVGVDNLGNLAEGIIDNL